MKKETVYLLVGLAVGYFILPTVLAYVQGAFSKAKAAA